MIPHTKFLKKGMSIAEYLGVKRHLKRKKLSERWKKVHPDTRLDDYKKHKQELLKPKTES